MARKWNRWTDLQPAPQTMPLQSALRKIQQAEGRLRELYATDLNAATHPQDFARMVGDFGVLIREAKKQLEEEPAFIAWWQETRPQSQRVVPTAQDRRLVGLVIDACNEENHANGPALRPTQSNGATHKYEFVTASGSEPVYPACLRAFGLLKEWYRVAAGLPEY